MQLGEGRNTGDCEMSEKVKSQMISRREAFSLLGLAAALGFALPAEVLTASDAEAQATTPAPTAPAPTGGTHGMQRRQARRTGRHKRREERRTGRHERREKRRGGGESHRKEVTQLNSVLTILAGLAASIVTTDRPKKKGTGTMAGPPNRTSLW
jgi:hypothetical protein